MLIFAKDPNSLQYKLFVWRYLLLPVMLMVAQPMLQMEARAGQKLLVAVSVLPLKYQVDRIGGERVQVFSLVRPGVDPHSYEPGAKQITTLARAALMLKAGMPFESAWRQRFRAANSRMRELDLGKLMKPEKAALNSGRVESAHKDESDHDDHDDSHGVGHVHSHGDDPHWWTSPILALRAAKAIRDQLIELLPEHEDEFRQNHAVLEQDLRALDDSIQDLLKPLRHRRFMVFHPAWGHFAQRYGLEQIAIEDEGKTLGAQRMALLIDQARSAGIRVLFVQPQSDQRAAKQVASAIGAELAVLNPLAPDYIANMRQVAQMLRRAGLRSP